MQIWICSISVFIFSVCPIYSKWSENLYFTMPSRYIYVNIWIGYWYYWIRSESSTHFMVEMGREQKKMKIKYIYTNSIWEWQIENKFYLDEQERFWIGKWQFKIQLFRPNHSNTNWVSERHITHTPHDACDMYLVAIWMARWQHPDLLFCIHPPLRFSWSLYDKEARRLILLNHSNVRRVRVKERWRNWSRFWMCNSINSSFAIWYILKTPKCYSIQHGFMWLFGLKRIKWEEITKKSITSAKSKGTTELTTNEIERKWNRKANNVECKTKSHCEPERSIGKVKKKKELKTESNAEKTNVSGEKDFCRRDVQSMSIWARWWRDQRKPQQQQHQHQHWTVRKGKRNRNWKVVWKLVNQFKRI